MSLVPRRTASVVALALALAAAPLAAQTWAPVGPPGGDVRSLAADPRDPRTVYLGTADGVVYRSDDGGLRWRRLTPGFPLRGVSLDDIGVDPRGRILAGYWEVGGGGGGVARSVDGGGSFSLLPGLAGRSVRALAVAASNPDVIVAGTLSGVFRSDDGGETWRRISPEGHPEIRNVGSVAVDSADSHVVYAGTWHLPWKTMDGGRTWRQVPAGMINDSDVMTLTVDHRDPKVVYATACTGIYRSLDAGGRWLKARGIPASSRRTRSFAQDTERPDTLYAGTTEGLWASEDGALTWRRLTPATLVVNAVLVLPGGTVLLGCEGAGVLRSTDRGLTWEASNEGFSERLVSRVMFDRGQGRVLAGILGDRSHGGVFAAPEPRGPWQRLGEGLDGREVLSLTHAGAAVLAGTDDGVFVLEPPGRAWRRLPTVVEGRDLHPRVADLRVLPGGVLLAATSRGLLRSTDVGESWTHLELGLAAAVSAVAASSRDPRVVLAATPLGFHESRDAGATWSEVSKALSRTTIRGLAFLPGDDRVVFATTVRGLLKSVDGGRTWSLRGLALANFFDVTGLAFGPEGRTVYASDFSRGGLYRSEDAGETWRTFPTSGLASERIWALALDPGTPGRLLAAAGSGGLHLFTPPPSEPAAGSR